MIWASPILIYPSSLLYSSIPSHSIPIHIQSLLFLFISSVLIPLFAIALNFSFPFIFISTHPLFSLLSFYPFSILQSILSYLSFHPPSLLYSILIHPLIILPIHSFPHPLSPILFSFHSSSISISTPLSYTLLPLSFTNTLLFDSLLLFFSLFPYSFLFPFYSSYCFSSPLSLPLSSSTLIHATSILFILFSPNFRSFYSNHLLYHPYSFPYYLSLSITSSTISLTTSFSYFPLTSITLPSTNTTIKSLHTHILSTHSFFSSSSTTPSSSTSFQTLSAVLSHSLSHTLYYPPFSSPNTHRFFSYPMYNPSPLQSTLTTSTSLYNPSS